MSECKIKIEVFSRSEAGRILCSPRRCAEITHLISIGDDTDPLPAGFRNVERRVRWLIADVVTEDGASEEDVQRIIDLAERLRSETGTLLIHCEAGISRSTATALIMYACWLGQGREEEAMERVIAQRPYSSPNRRMVALADELLGLDGRLLQARDERAFYWDASSE
jgi:predicted protein tyrosine phosphatase